MHVNGPTLTCIFSPVKGSIHVDYINGVHTVPAHLWHVLQSITPHPVPFQLAHAVYLQLAVQLS